MSLPHCFRFVCRKDHGLRRRHIRLPFSLSHTVIDVRRDSVSRVGLGYPRPSVGGEGRGQRVQAAGTPRAAVTSGTSRKATGPRGACPALADRAHPALVGAPERCQSPPVLTDGRRDCPHVGTVAGPSPHRECVCSAFARPKARRCLPVVIWLVAAFLGSVALQRTISFQPLCF